MSSNPLPPIITEADLAEQLGVQRGFISIGRKPGGVLIENTHWLRGDNGRVEFLDPLGVNAVRSMLTLPAAPEKKEGPPPDIYELTVARHPVNARLLECRLAGASRLVRVRLSGDTQRQHPTGKTIYARPVGDPKQGLFDLVKRTPPAQKKEGPRPSDADTQSNEKDVTESGDTPPAGQQALQDEQTTTPPLSLSEES